MNSSIKMTWVLSLSHPLILKAFGCVEIGVLLIDSTLSLVFKFFAVIMVSVFQLSTNLVLISLVSSFSFQNCVLSILHNVNWSESTRRTWFLTLSLSLLSATSKYLHYPY
jgi:hypothetical protein